MQIARYTTEGGIEVTREISEGYHPAITPAGAALAERRGVLFSSSFEFPGRYTRWEWASPIRRSSSPPAASHSRSPRSTPAARSCCADRHSCAADRQSRVEAAMPERIDGTIAPGDGVPRGAAEPAAQRVFRSARPDGPIRQ